MAVLWGLFLYDYWIVNWHDAGMFGYACAGILLMVIVIYGLFSMLVWVVRGELCRDESLVRAHALQMLLARPLCSLALFAVFVLSVAMWVRWPGMLVVFGLSLPMLAGTACVYWFGRLPGMDVRAANPTVVISRDRALKRFEREWPTMSAILITPRVGAGTKGSPMVTMKEVAEAAGVSIATVSRVLNGKDRGRIKPEIAGRSSESARTSATGPIWWPAT